MAAAAPRAGAATLRQSYVRQHKEGDAYNWNALQWGATGSVARARIYEGGKAGE